MLEKWKFLEFVELLFFLTFFLITVYLELIFFIQNNVFKNFAFQNLF